ncbi:spore-associated protein A [Kitasatospora sp. NPDC058063]|uniref:spore-associated protein A n=1 Tax=unclassified Kitasatospora TaxID=2633591 RepID=UPI0036DBEEAB
MKVKRMRSIHFTRIGRRMATAVGLLGISAASIVATAGPASAQEAAYNGACGSGYNVKDWEDIYAADGRLSATIYLTYSSGTGKNCVVTIKNGQTTYMVGAFLENDNDPNSWTSDYGNYMKYAGPVYVYAKGSCVSWGGAYMESEVHRWHTNCGALAG